MWIVWLCVLAAVLAALTVLIFLRLPFEFEYAASAARQEQRFQIRICGIRLIRGKGQEDKTEKAAQAEEKKAHKPQESDEEKNGKNDEFGFSQFMERIDGVKHIYKLVKSDIEDILTYLKTRIQCRNLTVHLDFGFSDAAQTGIAAGVAYGVVYGFASIVYNNLPLRKDDMDIAVTPHFNRQCADFYTKSIFCLSIAHIIKVLTMLLAIHKKIKKIKKQ